MRNILVLAALRDCAHQAGTAYESTTICFERVGLVLAVTVMGNRERERGHVAMLRAAATGFVLEPRPSGRT